MKHVIPFVLACSLTGTLVVTAAWAGEQGGESSNGARFEHRNGPDRFGYGYERRQTAGQIPRHLQHFRSHHHDQR